MASETASAPDQRERLGQAKVGDVRQTDSYRAVARRVGPAIIFVIEEVFHRANAYPNIPKSAMRSPAGNGYDHLSWGYGGICAPASVIDTLCNLGDVPK